jgi:mono/diheme cytochrome c family protein
MNPESEAACGWGSGEEATMRASYIIGVLALAAMAGVAQGRQQQPAESSQAPSEAAKPTAPNPHYAITDEDRARKNPVDFTELTVERGKKIFESQCSMCHGEKGDGQGEMAEEMKLNLPDFTKAATLKARTDGELFKIIDLGNPVMPAQDKRMKDIHVWEIVNFLRATGGAAPGKSTGKELSDQTYTEVSH